MRRDHVLPWTEENIPVTWIIQQYDGLANGAKATLNCFHLNSVLF